MLVRCGSCFEPYDNAYEVCPHCGYVRGDPARELNHLYPGMVLNNRYCVGQVLGFGGFGITYKVWDKHLGAVLAIKEYYPSGLVNRVPGTRDVILFTGNRQAEYRHGLTRFLDEARNMAKFNAHKNIINVFEYFEENNTAYIVMEYLDGVTLNQYLKHNRFDLETSVAVVQRVCAALKDIHAAGIVHRDVSPDNIFLCANNVIKLIDFGAARFYADEDKQMTIILKPGFAPPEQYERVNVQGPWTDIYALGATLYQMVTGVKPDESTNRKVSDTLASPMELDPAVPEYISLTIMKAMAIDKHMRFSSVTELEKALGHEKKVLPVAREKKRRKRRRLVTVLAAALAIVIAASILLMNLNWQERLHAEISLWYRLTGDEAADRARAEAFQSIKEAFQSDFPNVKIDIRTFTREEYAPAIREAISAGKAPALFESAGLDSDILNSALDLSGVVNAVDKDQCHFLDGYARYFPQKRQLPLGFTAPAVYLNTSLLELPDDGLKDIGALFDASSGARQVLVLNGADVPAFANAYGDAESVETDDAKQLFLTSQADAYFSDTSEFFDVQRALPARYKLLRVDSGQVPGAFCDLWSIGNCGGGERTAAEQLLKFMLGDKAQDYLHIQNQGKALPINKVALERFVYVYNDFDGFFSNIGDYDFAVNP